MTSGEAVSCSIRILGDIRDGAPRGPVFAVAKVPQDKRNAAEIIKTGFLPILANSFLAMCLALTKSILLQFGWGHHNRKGQRNADPSKKNYGTRIKTEKVMYVTSDRARQPYFIGRA
jgi:hypothetical protein